MKHSILLALLCLMIAGCQDLGSPPLTSLSVDNPSSLEGSTVTFTIHLNQIDSLDISVSWQLVGGSAQAGTDFTADSGVISIPAGDLSATIHVTTFNDSLIEPGKQFVLILFNAQNVVMEDSIGTATIWDDDGVRYAATIKPILVNSCAFTDCHGDGSKEGGLAMGDASYDAIRNASGDIGAAVVPGDASKSPLYLVTTPTAMPDIDRMPSGGPYLTTGQQKLIKDWIDQGAQDN